MKPDDDMLAGFVYDQLENQGDEEDEEDEPLPWTHSKSQMPTRDPSPSSAQRPPDPNPHSDRSWSKILFWVIALLALFYALSLLNSK